MNFWKAAIAAIVLACAVPAYADKPDILETIDISGVINDGMAADVTQRVTELNENPRVKAVLLNVDSPGGGVLPSAIIYEELSKLKVPVVGYCQNICASGGMYVLMAPSVKFIAVRTSTITGSIGVVMHITRYNRLLDWAKIDSATYKSGISKDTGSPDRAETPEDRVELQGEIDTLAARFYSLVEKSRGKKLTNFAEVKTARVYFGADGVKAGLVDAVMSKEDVVAYAKKLSASKSIFTREELKKMSKDSADDRSYERTAPTPLAQMLTDLHDGANALRTIARGSSISLDYLAPYQF